MFDWILEYGKVLTVYLFILYVWPSVVFRNYLSKKGMAFRFSFCITFMILLLNTVVLLLGIAKLLNPWIIRILFYGPFFFPVGVWLYRHRSSAIYIKYLLTGIYKPKRLISDIMHRIGMRLKACFKKIWSIFVPHWPVYLIMTLAVIYGMIYFSYGAFHERYYGAPDASVHHSWIDMLLNGVAFGAGVYPEGMHCFVYTMHVLFGVEIYSCMLFLGGIQISALLVSVYLFFKEIFVWKFSGVLIVVLYLFLQHDTLGHIYSMSRLQWTIPQEFAMFSVFLCSTYLLRFLRKVPVEKVQWKRWKFVRDENLLVFLMALAVSLALHFYVTLMAFFLCLAIGIFFLYWVFARKQFMPLLAAILCGVVIAVTPMLLALATGTPFQGSIRWAMGVIEDSQEAIQVAAKQKEEAKPNEIKVNGITWEIEEPELITDEDWVEILEEQKKPEDSFITKFYKSSFAALYNATRARWLAGFVILDALLGVLCCILAMFKQKVATGTDPFWGYLFLVAAVLVFMLLTAAPQLNLVSLFESGRLGTITHILTIATIIVPLDLLITLINKKTPHLVIDICSCVLCLAMCISVIFAGEYHSHLFYYLTRYPAAAEITNQIANEMKPQSYTIVSAFDELHQIKAHGFHEEVVRFINEMNEDSYTLPTEYVFIYLEKKPLRYSHCHLVDGASWLAGTEYQTIMGRGGASQAPEIYHTDISDEYANKDVRIPITFKSYTNSEYRTIIFSRLNQWVEKFQELYPYQLTTVYEDDAFVCYMFRQNPARLLELAIMN